MKISIDFEKIGQKAINFLKRLPGFVAHRAFIFYIVFFAVELFFGIIVYYRYAFPDLPAAGSSQIELNRQLIGRAVNQLEKEEKALEELGGKEYFDLIELTTEEETEEVD